MHRVPIRVLVVEASVLIPLQVRTRKTDRTAPAVLEAFEYNLYETTICLVLATVINAVMLILAAAHFYPVKVRASIFLVHRRRQIVSLYR